jgi:hypothetical protein
VVEYGSLETTDTAPVAPIEAAPEQSDIPIAVDMPVPLDIPADVPPAPVQEAPPVAAAPDMDLGLGEFLESKPAAGRGAGFELSLDELAMEQPSPAAVQPPATTSAGADGQPRAQAPAPAAPSPAAAPAGGFLDDVFAEFKEDVGESAATGEQDMETHYNMGVAFKEMALYDEAIGEFQKMHQLAETAKDYSHVVQCCSLLATCFLEKGMPEIAVKWFKTAIDAPGVDADSILALLYEMGSAQETAGDRTGALKSFKDVYARNIDYRNVADRIRDLQ